MARSRNIKPGFFKNEELAELPFEVRLLFIGLWTMADREGRLEDRPKKIKMELFPVDNVDVDHMLTQLAGKDFIVRYEANSCKYIAVLNFKKHQNPHHKEQASTIPAPDMPEACPADSLNLIPDSLKPIKDIIVLTKEEQEFLNVLEGIKNYPVDRKADLEMYHKMGERYPTLDRVEAIKDWATYKLDKPLKAKDNPRSQINTSFKKYTGWGRNIKPSQQTPTPKEPIPFRYVPYKI